MHDIIETLTPLFNDDMMRRVVVDEAFFGINQLINHIDYSNNARVFTSVLVRKLLDYGDIEKGTPAIIALLDVAKHYVGLDQQIVVEDLINRYRELLRAGGVETSNPTDQVENPHKQFIRCKDCGAKNEYNAQWCACGYPLTEMSIEQTAKIELIYDPLIHFDYSRQLLGLNPADGHKSIQLDFNLRREARVIGRGEEFSDIDLSGYKRGNAVSRTHAVIEWARGKNVRGKVGVLRIKDLDSTNGTYLNDERLVANQYRPVADGDEICFGELTFKISFNERS